MPEGISGDYRLKVVARIASVIWLVIGSAELWPYCCS